MTSNFAASSAAIAAMLAVAPAALAQETAPPPAEAPVPAPAPQQPASQQPEPAQPAPAQPAPAQPEPAQNADVAGPGAGQAAPAPAANPQIVAFIDQEFPKADIDADGKLSETEFKTWITQLKTAELQAQGQPVEPAKVEMYATNAFAMTDKDSDKLVDKADLVAFFSGG